MQLWLAAAAGMGNMYTRTRKIIGPPTLFVACRARRAEVAGAGAGDVIFPISLTGKFATEQAGRN